MIEFAITVENAGKIKLHINDTRRLLTVVSFIMLKKERYVWNRMNLL